MPKKEKGPLSVALGAEETIEHLLKAVVLALLDIPSRSPKTAGPRPCRHLRSAARAAAKQVAQDLAKNV
jgi:hypothetical protein